MNMVAMEQKTEMQKPEETADISARPELQAPKHKTKGEKLFDTFVYGGLGYGVNFVSSVLVGYYFLKNGGKGFYQATEKIVKNVLNKGFSPEWAEKISHYATRISFLGAGGHLTMIPVKLLEDRKKRLVYWLNSKFFPGEYEGKIPIKPLETMKDEDLPEVVEQPAKMSWGKMAARRLAIYLAVPALLAPFGKANDWMEGKVRSVLRKGASASARLTGSNTLAKFERSQRFNDYLEVGAADIYLSIISAVMVNLTNGAHGFFGKKKEHKKEEQKTSPAQSIESSAEQSRASFAAHVKPYGPYTDAVITQREASENQVAQVGV
jgi:hypothetical protein